MSSITEIKHRIASVRDTRKITNAMYLIASTKVRKAKNDLDRTRPYFTALKKEIDRMFAASEEMQSKYLAPEEEPDPCDGTYGVLVITADKGLAGAYNQNVLKTAQKLFNEHRDSKMFVVGEYGRQYFSHHGVPVESSFLYTAQNPTLHRAREICELLLALYNSGKLKRISVVYTDFAGGRTGEVNAVKLLPIDRGGIDTSQVHSTAFEYEPSVERVLDSAIHSFIAGFVYSALVDSYCCEQNARMVAMSGADKNAEEILSDLSLQYNRVRQAAITQEITEVTAGAKSMKNNGAKR